MPENLTRCSFLHYGLKAKNKEFLQWHISQTLTVVMMLWSGNIQLYMASESKVQTPMTRNMKQFSELTYWEKTKQDVQDEWLKKTTNAQDE